MNKIKLVVNNGIKINEREKFFIKQELQSILNLYAKMVSNGSWKDYSFTSGIKEVSFNVYQRASEKPVLRILKNLISKVLMGFDIVILNIYDMLFTLQYIRFNTTYIS